MPNIWQKEKRAKQIMQKGEKISMKRSLYDYIRDT